MTSNSTLTRTLDFEPLEDRLLFSATPAGAVEVPDKAEGGSGDSTDASNSSHHEASGEGVSVEASTVTAANTASLSGRHKKRPPEGSL